MINLSFVTFFFQWQQILSQKFYWQVWIALDAINKELKGIVCNVMPEEWGIPQVSGLPEVKLQGKRGETPLQGGCRL
jgi:hypothetical protein